MEPLLPLGTPSVSQIVGGRARRSAMNTEARRREAPDLYGVLPPKTGARLDAEVPTSSARGSPSALWRPLRLSPPACLARTPPAGERFNLVCSLGSYPVWRGRLSPAGSLVAFAWSGHAETGRRTSMSRPSRVKRFASFRVPHGSRVRRFSPDGSRIAFASFRSGASEIWIAGRDGSGLQQVISIGFMTTESSWSYG